MLRELRSGLYPMPPKLRLVCFMAGAVPVELLKEDRRLRPPFHQSRHFLTLFSPGDSVLRFAFPAGQTIARLLGERLGERSVYWRAHGLHGEPTDLTSHRYQHFVARGEPANHGDYWPSTLVAEHVARYLGDWTPNRLFGRALNSHLLSPGPRRTSLEIKAHRLG